MASLRPWKHATNLYWRYRRCVDAVIDVRDNDIDDLDIKVNMIAVNIAIHNLLFEKFEVSCHGCITGKFSYFASPIRSRNK